LDNGFLFLSSLLDLGFGDGRMPSLAASYIMAQSRRCKLGVGRRVKSVSIQAVVAAF
jgi:hypothetical protein